MALGRYTERENLIEKQEMRDWILRLEFNRVLKEMKVVKATRVDEITNKRKGNNLKESI